MILFVGDRPSSRNKDPKVAFVGTESHKRLKFWITAMGLDGEQIMMINRVDNCLREVVETFHKENYPIIALGRQAETALSNIVSIDHFYTLPHPSGRNRQNNDVSYISKQLQACLEYIRSRS